MAFVPLRDVLLKRKKELLEELYEVDLALEKAGTKQLFITEPPRKTPAGVDGADMDRPSAEGPDVDRPGIDRPGVDRPGVDRPGVDRPICGLFGLPPGKAAKKLLEQEKHPRTRAEIVATLLQRGAAAGSKNPERTIQRALDVNLAIGLLRSSGDLIGLPEWFEVH